MVYPPPFWGSFAQNAPRYGIRYLSPCRKFNFDPHSPPPLPRYPILGGLGGWGVKISLHIAAAVCGFGPVSWTTFFLIYQPSNPWRGLGVQTPGTSVRPPPPRCALAGDDLASFVLDRLFRGT